MTSLLNKQQRQDTEKCDESKRSHRYYQNVTRPVTHRSCTAMLSSTDWVAMAAAADDDAEDVSVCRASFSCCSSYHSQNIDQGDHSLSTMIFHDFSMTKKWISTTYRHSFFRNKQYTIYECLPE